MKYQFGSVVRMEGLKGTPGEDGPPRYLVCLLWSLTLVAGNTSYLYLSVSFVRAAGMSRSRRKDGRLLRQVDGVPDML